MSSSAPPKIQSVERALRLLELMAEGGGSASIRELSTATGLPAPTVYRLLRTMVDLGYLRRLPHRRYGFGKLLLRLGAEADESPMPGSPKTLDVGGSRSVAGAGPRLVLGPLHTEGSERVALHTSKGVVARTYSIDELVVGLRVEALVAGQVRHWGPVQEVFPARNLVWIFDFQSGSRRLLEVSEFDEIRQLVA